MVPRSSLAVILMLSLVLLSVWVMAQTRETMGTVSPPMTKEFVRNLTLGGEKFVVSTVVLRRDTPQHIAGEIYGFLERLYTTERDVATYKRTVKVKEVRISKLVRDREGRYLMRVVERPETLSRLLARYEEYIERIVAKPLPSTMPMTLESGMRGIAPANARVRELIGASTAESAYGLTGAGVNIAIVDTGVDYGHPDLTTALRYWSGTYKGDSIREPLVLDADMQQVILLQDVTLYNSTHIYVGGRSYITLVPWPAYITPPCDFYRVSPTISRWLSQGGAAKFGLTYMIRFDGIKIHGVLMARFPGATFYTRVIVDVAGNCYFDAERAPPFDPYARSHILRYESNRIIAPDFDGNGFPDESLGVAGGFFYDWWWWFSYPAEIHPGWDKNGRWLSIFYDFDGHGTAAASAAAGRGAVLYRDPVTGETFRLRGIAPGAGVVGVKALWIGNVEVGMLWAAGFDIDPYRGSFYYTGSPRARIISNSWGISYFAYDFGAFGYDLESVFVAALTLPGYLDPAFPGVLVVQAGGNGGPGYGTITSPGSAPGILTVGASTLTYFAFRETRANNTLFASGAGWTSDEVISWSLRGPTVVGYVKPDVVNVGAFGYTAAPVRINYTLFGGTSYATPLTAGVAALVYQVLPTADPALVKNIITSTADSLRYDVTSQGAGRVNAFRATSLARLIAGQRVAKYEIQIFSTSLWASYAEKISSLWRWHWCDNIRAYMLWWAGTDFVPPSCELPSTVVNRLDSTLFFGDISRGGAKSISVTIRNPTNRTISVSISPRMFNLTRTVVITRHLSLSPDASYNRTYIVFTSHNVTATLRFLEAIATIPYSRFDANNDYLFDVRVRVWIHLWRSDANRNGRPDPDEMVLVNYGYNHFSWNLATISNPAAKLSGNLGIVISVDLVRGPDAPLYVPPVPVTLTINAIDTFSDPWVSISPTSATIPPGGSATFTLTARPPSNAIPTTYVGELVVTNNLTGTANIVPYSFNVFAPVGPTTTSLTAGVFRGWPPPRLIRGAGNWAWRFEAGDWRWFFVRPAADNALAFELETRWTLPDTSLITFTIGPDGQFAGVFFGQGASYFWYLGRGRFAWTGTGAGSIENARRVVTFPAIDYRLGLYPHTKPETGVFTYVVRSAVFDGSSGASEPFNVTARVIQAQQKLPALVFDRATLPIRFSLPYIAGPIYAYVIEPHTPLLDFDQRYARVWYSISPSYVGGVWPPGTQFTFQQTVSIDGVHGQKVDLATIFLTRLPSLPIFERYRGTYYRVDDYYIFEDWVRVVKS